MYVKRRRVSYNIQSSKNSLRDVPLYNRGLSNGQIDNSNDTTSSTNPTSTSQFMMINLIGFGAVFGVILLFMIIIGIIAFFYNKKCRKQIVSEESTGSIDSRDDYDDDCVYESELFNDKNGCIVVDTTRSSNNVVPIKKSVRFLEPNQYNNNNNPPASIYNNNLTTRPPPAFTLLSTINYKQPKSILRGSHVAASNSFSNLKFATTTTTTITTTTTTNNNESWFKKPVDSPIIPRPSSKGILKSLSSSNWSKAPWQDDDNINTTDSETSSMDYSYENEIPKKEKSFCRFSLFKDFRRNEVINCN